MVLLYHYCQTCHFFNMSPHFLASRSQTQISPIPFTLLRQSHFNQATCTSRLCFLLLNPSLLVHFRKRTKVRFHPVWRYCAVKVTSLSSFVLLPSLIVTSPLRLAAASQVLPLALAHSPSHSYPLFAFIFAFLSGHSLAPCFYGVSLLFFADVGFVFLASFSHALRPMLYLWLSSLCCLCEALICS